MGACGVVLVCGVLHKQASTLLIPMLISIEKNNTPPSGSCYIFAPTAALESQMMINRLGGVSSGGAPKINLSEQQLVNCAPNVPFGRKQPYDPCDGGVLGGFLGVVRVGVTRVVDTH